MIVRSLDINHDWNFGKGKNDYLRDKDAIGQSIDTRLLSFLNDCFFDTAAGIDWFTRLGSKDILSTKLDIRTTILSTENVTSITELSFNLDDERTGHIVYSVDTIFGLLEQQNVQVP